MSEVSQLIRAEIAAAIITIIMDDLERNGNPLYTIRLTQLALDQFYEQQLVRMDTQSSVNE